jgi:hypothetical protein
LCYVALKQAAMVDLAEDRFAREPGTVGAIMHFAADLCGDDDLVTAGKVFQCASQV